MRTLHARLALSFALACTSCSTSIGTGSSPDAQAEATDAGPDGRGDARAPATDALVSSVDGCGNSPVSMSILPGNLVIVFDQSDSMRQSFSAGADGGVSGPKYQVAEDAIVAATTPIKDKLNIGAVFFPTTATGNLCSLVAPITKPPQIQIEAAASFEKDFTSHFAAKGWSLLLGTPLKIALDQANAALPDPSPLKGARAVVIVTDGAPTCDTAQADLLAPVQSMYARGIKTFVVGLPGSKGASTLLDAIAKAGGTNSYVAPADPAALEAAFASLAKSTVSSCVMKLGMPTMDATQLHLVVTDAGNPKGVEIPAMGASGGWTLSQDGTTVTLTGDVCTKAENGTYTTIQFVYGCLPPIG